MIWLATLIALPAAPGTLAETLTNNAAAIAANGQPALADGPTEHAWSFTASVYGYLVPDSRDFVQPIFTADHDWLHLEARYNYESLETGSAWIGYNFGGGKKLAWQLTPMLGGVFGDSARIAPGFTGSLSWWRLELYTQGEFVLDTRDSSQSYFYNWSELSLSPIDWFRFGLVTERTRVYKTNRDLQRGFLVGFSYKQADFTTYVFNLDDSKPIVVLALGLKF